MTRKSTSCTICENSNVASICAACVNYRLNDYSTVLKSLRTVRDSLYMRLSGELMAKNKADDQHKWRVSRKEKLAQLRQQLRLKERQLSQGKAELEKVSNDLKVQYALLESASALLGRNRVEQLEKFYPNLICTQNLGLMHITSERLHKQSVIIKQACKLFPQRRVNSDGERKDGSSGQYDQICNARLPKGLDPHSVPSEELAASLGYMVQLLNLIVKVLAAPALHNSGFAYSGSISCSCCKTMFHQGSCSRIWQRDSYWDACPSSRSNEYPLFIPRQNSCSAGGDSWSDRSSSNFGFTSVESEKKPLLEAARSSSFNYSSASPHSVETHKDLQKGISLLKKSVACITAYCYNSLYLDIPSEASTFEAFAKLLSTLSSSREIRSVLSLKMAPSRSCEQVQQLNRSFWHVNSDISSRSLAESTHTTSTMQNACDNLSNSAASFLSIADMVDARKSESLAEGWDIVEHPTFPPPPSQAEDIEHWTRAMIIDATKR